MVQRRHLEHTASLAILATCVFEIRCLNNHRKVLHEKHSAQQGYKQLLVDEYGKHSDDTSECQRTRVAHKHLCGKSIIPQETDECTDKRGHIHHQLLGSRNIHYIEIRGVDHITAKICHGQQSHAYYGTHPGGQTVNAVGQIGTVGGGGHSQYHHHDKHYPSAFGRMASHPRCQARIVEVIVFHKRDGGAGGFDITPLADHFHHLGIG